MMEPVVLRDDLEVVEKHENGDHYYLVQDPRNDESYEFGEQEWYLLNCMDGELDLDGISDRFSEEYLIELTREQLSSFISMVKEWGLLKSSDDEAADTKDYASSYSRNIENNSVSQDIIDITPSDVTELIAVERPFRPGMNRPPAAKAEASEVNWVLFNPNRLFSGLNGILYSLRWLRYIIPLLVVIGCAIIFNNFQVFVYDFLRVRTPLSIIQILIFSMFTVNLVSQLTRGIVTRGYGVDVNEFGIRFIFGVVPRFAVAIGNIENLARNQRLVINSSALLCRLMIFSLATLLWLMSRTTGTMLPTICLMLLTVAVFSFF